MAQRRYQPEMAAHGRLAFSTSEYERRYRVVTDAMRRAGIDVLLVRGPENICYLTGYETPAYYGYHCLILPRADQPMLVLRNFEWPNIHEYSWLTDYEIVWDHEAPTAVLARVLGRMGLADKRIGVEMDGWFFSVNESRALLEAFPEAELVNVSGRVVEEARLVKSAEEIATMRKAARILDRAIEAGIDRVAGGVTDNQVAAEVHRVLIENGSHYPSLPPFVLSGRRTSLPHQTWRSQMIEEGDPVYFESSANLNRYSAAIMRCAHVGEPSRRVRRMANTVIAACEAAVDKIRAGVTCEAVDRANAAVIEKSEFRDYFRHRTGYSIGINFPPGWGEGQILALKPGVKRRLEENMTFHIVPLFLSYREVGIGFSACVRVTRTGCEVLNGLPRELVIK